MYHPAAALHQGSLRQTLLDDAQGIPAALLDARTRRELARSKAAARPDGEVPLGAAPVVAPAEPASASPNTPAMIDAALPVSPAPAGDDPQLTLF